MAEEKHHHLFHHHKKGEEQQPTGEYGGYSETAATEVVTTGEDEHERYEKEHKHKQHLGEAGALGAGAFALVRIRPSSSLCMLSDGGTAWADR